MMQNNNSKSTAISVTAIMAAVILWGCSFVAMRIVLRVLPPTTVVFTRMLTALIVLIPFFGKLRPKDFQIRDLRYIIPMVLFQPCLYFLFESNALTLTTSSQAGVIAASVPVLVAIGARFMFNERISMFTVTGLLLSVGGVIFLTMFQGHDEKAANPVIGNLLEAAAMLFAAGNMLIIKKLSRRYNPWTLTAFQALAGTLFFLPGAAGLVHSGTAVWTPQLIILMVFLGTFVTLGAFGMYNWGISRIDASKASSFINLVPVITIITGWLILGEGLTPVQTAAAAVVLAGVIIGQNSWGAKAGSNKKTAAQAG